LKFLYQKKKGKIMKKNLNSVFALVAIISLISVYACSTSNTTTTKPATKTDVTDNNDLPDRGLGNTKPDKRNKQGILKAVVNGKFKAPVVDSETGVTLSDYTFQVGTDDNKDGGENESGNGSIEIAGMGKHKIKLSLENYPVMDNKEDVETITDETTGNIRIYSADQDLQKYSISDGKEKLVIETNPDGTWTVDGKPAKTPAEVAKIAMQSPLFSEASPHGFAAIYQLFKNMGKIDNNIEVKTTLTPTSCNQKGVNAGEPGDPTELLKEGLKVLKEKK
jgi:hypothetical protein